MQTHFFFFLIRVVYIPRIAVFFYFVVNIFSNVLHFVNILVRI